MVRGLVVSASPPPPSARRRRPRANYVLQCLPALQTSLQFRAPPNCSRTVLSGPPLLRLAFSVLPPTPPPHPPPPSHLPCTAETRRRGRCGENGAACIENDGVAGRGGILPCGAVLPAGCCVFGYGTSHLFVDLCEAARRTPKTSQVASHPAPHPTRLPDPQRPDATALVFRNSGWLL